MPQDFLDKAIAQSFGRATPPEWVHNLSAFTGSLLAQVLDNVFDAAIILDASHVCVYVNAGFTSVTGYSAQEVLGRHYCFLQGEETNRTVAAGFHSALDQGETYRDEIVNYRKDGEPFWCQAAVTPLRDSAGNATHFVAIVRDISDRVAGQQHVMELLHKTEVQKETADLLLEAAHSLGEYSRLVDVAQAVSDAVPRLCGSDRSAVVLLDRNAQRFFVPALTGWEGEGAHRVRSFEATADSRPELTHLLSANVPVLINRDGPPWATDLLDEFHVEAIGGVPITSGNEVRGLVLGHWVDASPPTHFDESVKNRLSGLAALAAVALDKSQLHELLSWNAFHDELTGLPNRELLEEKLLDSLARAGEDDRTVAVIYGDIDRFKRTNDSLGHAAGDILLRHVAATLAAVLGPADTVARPSGDEFVMVLPGIAGIEEAYAVADRIEKALAKPVRIDGNDVSVTISLGIALSDGPLPRGTFARNTAEQLIDYADAAMYRVKAAKRGTAARLSVANELQLDSDLRHAIKRGEIVAHYQPQFDLRTGKIAGVEALARWQHPRLGPIPPSVFVPIAEDNGMIDEIGKFMIDDACALGAYCDEGGAPLHVSVNVSPRQLSSEGFFDAVDAALSTHRFPASLLTLEITESTLVSNVTAVRTQLERLRSHGVGVAVDDFGTGYSSLSQLHTLPVSELKIDQSFVQRDGSTGHALIAAVVGVSRGLGLRVVAEGVETDVQLRMVRDLDCDRAQGYLLGSPMSRADMELSLFGQGVPVSVATRILDA